VPKIPLGNMNMNAYGEMFGPQFNASPLDDLMGSRFFIRNTNDGRKKH